MRDVGVAPGEIGSGILSHQIGQDRLDGLLRLHGIWPDQILRLIVSGAQVL